MHRPALALLLVLIAAPLRGAEPAEKQSTYRWPHVTVDLKQKEVRVEAELSPALRGMVAALEFLLISGTQVGGETSGQWEWDRDYESVFVTKANPDNIHVGLMLAGLRPGPLAEPTPEGYTKDNTDRVQGEKIAPEQPAAPRASLVDIFVEWKEGEAVKRLRAEEFIFNRETQAGAKPSPFAFTGSFLVTNPEGKKVVAASQTFVVVSVFHDNSAILNLPYYAKNAHWAQNVGLEINANHLPPFFRQEKTIIEGTTERVIQVPAQHPVTLIFKEASVE